ncbi:probable galactinol--sucrose galactosyltransferase 2, partial [Gastrolobium bilobum]|uniref:probable galactinol--sucrose galactosyltransferase 2 n=1 Tax=Gastrolobium bilobum TaxID=150636 RepID=UPI002AB05CCB
MTITVVPTVEDGCLMVRGKVVLTHVPGNILVSPVGTWSAFLGATFTIPSSRNVFTLGILRGYRLLSLLRVKTWWMIPRVGKSASDIPVETQLLLLEAREESSLRNEMYSEDPTTENTFYILFLPVLDGQFRSTLQGTSSNELQFCIESGDADVQTSQSIEAVIVNSGDNPFELIWDSIKILEEHKGTFCHVENKKISLHLNWFGWCTWDAIYTEVSPQGTREGLQSLLNRGFSPKSIIIDGEWQETLNEFLKESAPIFEGTHHRTHIFRRILGLIGFPLKNKTTHLSNLIHYSDKILKKLALPDGSVLRARYADLPTRDCLFENHLMDGKSLLKIWNLNMLTGVVGVFNFQGLKSLEAEPRRITISGKVSSLDVEFLQEIAGENWNEECVVYAFNAGLLSKLPRRGKLEVSLETLQCEIYTVSPIRVFGHDFQIAPIGLLDMYNSGEAVEAMDCTMDAAQCIIKIRCRGCGRFGAYSNVRPKHCMVDKKEEEFFYNSEDGLLTIKFDGEADSKNIEL